MAVQVKLRLMGVQVGKTDDGSGGATITRGRKIFQSKFCD